VQATTTATDTAIRLESVRKVYDGDVVALNDVSIALPQGGFTAVMGPSGSGKSTFLHCAAGLDRPSAGRIWLGDTELTGKREAALTELRRSRIGFVFQAYNLIGALTIEQNITLPLKLAGRSTDQQFLLRLTKAVGLNVPLDRLPSKLSGGQQQRVAIARALITRPDVVFLDEPTGALDTRTARQVLQTLRQAVEQLGQTAVMVTHDPVAASFADRVLFLADGRFAGELAGARPEAIAQRMTHLGDW
jgi:putative ABC transport system ATP-binding protein